jgi:MoaA/NifB/PqqE/SkfB family radical SAM enzyme
MNKIVIPESYNYIGVFLTFKCSLGCSYCINNFNSKPSYSQELTGEQWIKHLNRIESRPDLPITLQGGEPTVHKDFYKIVNGIKRELNIDILTNGLFSIDKFRKNIEPERLKRESKYASIRVSYHVERMSLDDTMHRVKTLMDHGYSVGIWAVDHPQDRAFVRVAKELCTKEGIDFRIKEFLGYYNNKLYGSYKYPTAMSNRARECYCRPSELLIGPNGDIHRCHYHLYRNSDSVGSITAFNGMPMDYVIRAISS